MAPPAPLPSHTPGAINGDHNQSNGTSPYSTSPESSRSSRSHVSMKASSSTANAPSYMVNGSHSENTASEIAQSDPARDLSILSSRTNEVRARQGKLLARSKTELDFSTRRTLEAAEDPIEQNYELRHGWEHVYNSTQYLASLNGVRSRMYILALACRYQWLIRRRP